MTAPPSGTSTRAPRRWATAALFVASCAAALLIAEAAVRLLLPQQALPEWYRDDPVYGRSLKPDFYQRFEFLGAHTTIDVRTNSLGLRDVEPPPPGTGRPRILFLGDSFAFGYGIDVPDRLDTKLAQRFADAGRTVTTLNAGVPAWGTMQQLKFAREHLDRFDPDAIVLVYCGNDQQNDHEFLIGQTNFRERGVFYLPGKAWLRMHSHLYRLALYATAAGRQRIANRAHERSGDAARRDPQTASALTADDWERTRDNIAGFIQDVHRDRPHVTLYLIATEPADDEIRNELARIAGEPAVEFVDFSDAALRLDESVRRLPYDPHWSPAMHALAADALFDAIASRLETAPGS